MNYSKLLKFIEDNQQNDLKDFYDKSYNKLQDLNKRIDRTTLSLLVVVAMYFIVAKSSIESFNIGPFTIKDISIIAQFLPVLFSYLLFDLLISSIHKTEVLITVKTIFLSLYNQEVKPEDFDAVKNTHSFFTRMVLPFSFTTDMSRLVSGNTPIGLGCFGILLTIPLLSLYIAPFVFEFFMLKNIYEKSYDDLMGKMSFYLTIYINLVIIFYYIKVVLTNLSDLKSENN